MARELLKISCAGGLLKNKKISCGPSGPDRPGRRPYPGGLKPKTPTDRRPIGNLGHAPKFVTIGNLGNATKFVTIGKLGHALDFVAIGNLGNAIHFVNIGNLGNCFQIAKIANRFGWLHASGGGEGGQPLVIGNIGKIVTSKKLATPYINKPLQYGINDNTANSPIIVL